MKNILSFVMLAALPFWGSAQFSLTHQEMPDVNSHFNYSVSSGTPGRDYQQTGANHTWDYTDLMPESQADEKYQSAVSINIFFIALGNGAFGTLVADSLGFGQFQVKDIYDVFKTTSARMTAEGRSMSYQGIPVPQFYSDKDEIFQFPLDFQDRDSSTFKVSFSLGGQIEMIQQGYRITEADGWGTLKTPYKTYSNALRVKSTKVEVDSIKLAGIALPPIPITTVEYRWFIQGKQGPVMIVSGNELVGNFAVNQIRYEDGKLDLVGFEADRNTADTSTTVTITDTSMISGLNRSWKIDPGTFQYINGTNDGDEVIEVKFTQPGKYDVILSVTNRFGTTTEWKKQYIEVLDVTGISEHQNASDWKVYPIPFSDRIQVEGNQIPDVLSLVDAEGKVIREVYQQGELQGLGELPAGVYFLRINNSEVLQISH
ncbi:T9SS type A sorting domain-containing protein [bacterium SCSIO 12741]|nr:T9SS type A sorting domain-containing protein [bacterium SCSIO 12741]